MIEYDVRGWLALLFRMRGSVLPHVLPRAAVAAAIGAVAVFLYRAYDLALPALAHTLVGIALGLLLVFRTNASYDRWWEGRRLLGMVVNRSRDLARQVAAYVEPSAVRAELAALIRAHYWVSVQTLRRHDALATLDTVLTAAQRSQLAPISHRASVIARWITERLRDEATAGRLPEQRLQQLDTNLMSLADSLGGAERIARTPIPFAYAHHIKAFVVLFCYSAPFVMVDAMGWATPIATGLLALALFGVDEIGVEIEDPFGDDANDLPMDAIGRGLDDAVREIME